MVEETVTMSLERLRELEGVYNNYQEELNKGRGNLERDIRESTITDVAWKLFEMSNREIKRLKCEDPFTIRSLLR